MRAIALGVVVAAMLAGCEKPVEEMGYAEMQALAKEIEQRCTNLGLKPGTPQHQQCRQVEAQKEIYTRRANKVRRQNAADAMQQASQNYQQSIAIQQSRRINCTHRPAVGWGSATTTCY